MTMGLIAKNKIGFIGGTMVKPKPLDPKYAFSG